MIQVNSFFAYNSLRNFSYLILDKATGDAWVIDPYDSAPLISYIKKEGLNLKGILNTHHHFDHIRGNEDLVKSFNAPVISLGNKASINLDSEHQLDIIDSPGHTMDHQVFLWKKASQPLALFSGDTIFNAGVGNCRNGGDPEVLFETVQNITRSLPDETILYPGHDYILKNLEFSLACEPENQIVKELLKEARDSETEKFRPWTFKDERAINPFLRLHSPELKENILGTKTEANEKILDKKLFLELRKKRDNW